MKTFDRLARLLVWAISIVLLIPYGLGMKIRRIFLKVAFVYWYNGDHLAALGLVEELDDDGRSMIRPRR